MTDPASNRFASRRVCAIAVVALLLAMACAIAGCGRKARPEPRFGFAVCPKQTT